MSNELEELKERIRSLRTVQDIIELRRELGPNAEETARQKSRLDETDRISNKCDWGNICPSYEAEKARKRHQELLNLCAVEFESIYC